MNDILKKVLSYFGILAIGFILGVLVNIPACSNTTEPEAVYIEKHDTVKIDSIRIKWKEKPVEVYLHDTFYVKESGDTVQLDSLPIIKCKYEDTIVTDSTSTKIRIDYHGFDAGIDNIDLIHNYFEKQTTVVKEPKKVGLVWFVGAYTGYGVHGSMNTGTFGHGPEIGVGAGIGIGGRIK